MKYKLFLILAIAVLILLSGCPEQNGTDNNTLQPDDGNGLPPADGNTGSNGDGNGTPPANGGPCPDEVCDEYEQANPDVCPEDCGGEPPGNGGDQPPGNGGYYPPGREQRLSGLPECSGQGYTVAPVDPDIIVEISPLGTVNPSGHTIPTEHLYIHIGEPWIYEIYDLRMPGDAYITSFSAATDPIVPERIDYVINFSLCKDLHGYYDHVKELSDEIMELYSGAECTEWSVTEGNSCYKEVFHFVPAGTVIGGVGHQQMNFDFGTYDHRIKLDFANPYRYGYGYDGGDYGSPTLHKVCPFDYYEGELKEQLYDKLKNVGELKCGVTMQDIPGTLSGNWFTGTDTRWDEPASWDAQLSFVFFNEDPSVSIISIGGVFTDTGKWHFFPESEGTFNREFSGVTADGEIYCYEGSNYFGYWADAHQGKIIVQLIDDEEMKIEHQSGSCSGNYEFENPTTYNR